MALALIIDDNRQTADALTGMLKLWDIEVCTAYNPSVGLAMLAEKSPDIVLLDINMPDLDGFEVLSLLKRESHSAEIPVIVITSDDQSETARRVDQLGASDILIKPAMPETLENTLKKLGII